MTKDFWLSGHYIDFSEVAAIRQHIFGGATVYLRGGATVPVSKADEPLLLGGFKTWLKARGGADYWVPRPHPGTDTTDNGLQGT